MKPISALPPIGLNNAKKMARLALKAVSDELEMMLRAEVGRIAARHPDKVVTAVSSMGTYFIHLEELGNPHKYREIKAGVLKAFDSALQEFGWGAIPAPLTFVGRGNESVFRL